MHYTALQKTVSPVGNKTNEKEITNPCIFLLKMEGNKSKCLSGCTSQPRKGSENSPCHKVCVLNWHWEHSLQSVQTFAARDKEPKQAGNAAEIVVLDNVTLSDDFNKQRADWGGRGRRNKSVVKALQLLENWCSHNTFPEKQQQRWKVNKLFILSF